MSAIWRGFGPWFIHEENDPNSTQNLDQGPGGRRKGASEETEEPGGLTPQETPITKE